MVLLAIAKIYSFSPVSEVLYDKLVQISSGKVNVLTEKLSSESCLEAEYFLYFHIKFLLKDTGVAKSI